MMFSFDLCREILTLSYNRGLSFTIMSSPLLRPFAVLILCADFTLTIRFLLCTSGLPDELIWSLSLLVSEALEADVFN